MGKRSRLLARLKAKKLETAGSRVSVSLPARPAPSASAFGGFASMSMFEDLDELDAQERALMDEPVRDVIVNEGEWWTKWSSGGSSTYTQSYGTKAVGKSYSSYWTSRFDDDYSYGGWGSAYGESKPSVDLVGILGSVRRSANIVTNAEDGGEEKALTVQWAEGQPNTCASQLVYVSPRVVDPAYTLKKDWSADERTDVLVGEALAESAMKRTMDPTVEKLMTTVVPNPAYARRLEEAVRLAAAWEADCRQASEDGLDIPARPDGMVVGEEQASAEHRIRSGLWYTLERMAAERSVANDYPGFKGYFATHRSYYTALKAFADIQKALSKKESAVTAFASLQWELLHPEEHLDLPSDTRDVVVSAMQQFASASTSEERMNATVRVVEDILKRWPVEDEDDARERMGSLPSLGMPSEGRGDVVAGEVAAKSERSSPEDLAKYKGLPQRGDDLESLATWRDGTINHKVSVRESDVSVYAQHATRLSPAIQALRTRLKIRNEEHRLIEHGLRRGRLDEGSLYKMGFSAAGYDDPNVFEVEEVRSVPNVAFGLLIDESGSMREHDRYATARDIGIVVSNALMGGAGTHVAVLGHTAQYTGHDRVKADGMLLHHYFTPEHQSIQALGRVSGLGNNLDGFAIGATALHMIKWFENCPTKVLIHISDGYPCAAGYGGRAAMKHVGDTSMQCRADGVMVIGIGVDNAFNEAAGNTMYGPGNYILTEKVENAAGIIANIITKVVREAAMRNERAA